MKEVSDVFGSLPGTEELEWLSVETFAEFFAKCNKCTVEGFVTHQDFFQGPAFNHARSRTIQGMEVPGMVQTIMNMAVFADLKHSMVGYIEYLFNSSFRVIYREKEGRKYCHLFSGRAPGAVGPGMSYNFHIWGSDR